MSIPYAPFSVRTEDGIRRVKLCQSIKPGEYLFATAARVPVIYVNPKTDMHELMRSNGWRWAE